MNPFTQFVQQMLRQRSQPLPQIVQRPQPEPEPDVTGDVERILTALEQGGRATRRPMPPAGPRHE